MLHVINHCLLTKAQGHQLVLCKLLCVIYHLWAPDEPLRYLNVMIFSNEFCPLPNMTGWWAACPAGTCCCWSTCLRCSIVSTSIPMTTRWMPSTWPFALLPACSLVPLLAALSWRGMEPRRWEKWSQTPSYQSCQSNQSYPILAQSSVPFG